MRKKKKQIQGFLLYHEFKKVVKLTVNQRVQGNNIEQSNFREMLTRAAMVNQLNQIGTL